jgi:hypothetical protein
VYHPVAICKIAVGSDGNYHSFCAIDVGRTLQHRELETMDLLAKNSNRDGAWPSSVLNIKRRRPPRPPKLCITHVYIDKPSVYGLITYPSGKDRFSYVRGPTKHNKSVRVRSQCIASQNWRKSSLSRSAEIDMSPQRP